MLSWGGENDKRGQQGCFYNVMIACLLSDGKCFGSIMNVTVCLEIMLQLWPWDAIQ